MSNELVILHTTPAKDLISLFGQVVRDELRNFQPVPLPDPNPGEHLTRKEVCNRLKISLATLHLHTKNGILRGYKIGGKVLYKTIEIEQAVQAIQAGKYKRRV